MIVVVDYFTKWVEARAIAKIDQKNVHKFMWKNIIKRFGIHKCLIMVLVRQRHSQEFPRPFKIKLAYSAVFHPQCNGQVEAANKTIINCLKNRLDDKKKGWAEALYSVLWSLRTTRKEATCHTLFNLVFWH